MTPEPAAPASLAGRIGAAIGCTEGQVSTIALGLFVAVVLGLTGLPPVLEDRVAPRLPARTAAVLAPVTTTTTTMAEAGPAEPEFVPSFPAFTPPPTFRDFSPDTAPSNPSTSPTTVVAAAKRPKLPFGTFDVFSKVGQPGSPSGIALTAEGTVVAATNNSGSAASTPPSELQIFSGAGVLQKRIAVKGQPTNRSAGLDDLVLDSTGAAVVLDVSTSRVLRVVLTTGAQDVYATIPDVPACLVVGVSTPCEPGATDHAPNLSGLAFDGRGRLFVTDAGQATVWLVDKVGAKPAPWFQSTDFASGNGLAGIAADDSSMVLTVEEAYNTDNPFGGEVYRVAVNANGSAGTARSIAHLDQSSAPKGVAIGPDSSIYVVLSGTNAVVSLKPDGSEQARFASKASDTVKLDAPSGAVVWGSSLLISNQSTATTPDRWALIEIGIEK